MKCVCISCFDHHPTRFEYITDFFRKNGYKTYYIITDYLHFEKRYQKTKHEDTIHIHIPGYKKNMSLKRLHSHAVFAKKIYKELERIKPDIIYCMFPPNSLVKTCAKYKNRNKHIGLIFDCYDCWPESMTKGSIILQIPFKVWRGLRDNYLNYADKLITASELSTRFFQDIHPEMDIVTLYPRLPERPEISYCTDTSDSIKFCYLGNINYITDIDLLTEVLTAIRKKKKVVLHHIGGGQNLEELKTKLHKNEIDFISHGIIFDDERKEKIFSICNLGINMPRQEIKSSMSLKSIEYMRAGLPFINSGIGDNWEIVDKYSVGINCTIESILDVSTYILEMNDSDYKVMHMNVVTCYRKLFGAPDYKRVFSGVPNMSIEE